MKVALVNNMNNNFFAFTRYLRELGVDAHLFIVDRLLDHFQPACDSFDEISSLSYIHEVAQLDPLDFYRYFFSRKLRRRLKHFRDELEQFDVVIACGNLTHLIRLGIKIDIFIPYGRDAYYFVDYPEASLRRRNYFKYLFAKRLDFLQNKSIKEARVMITLADYSKKVKEAFTRLGRSWINWSVPMVYLLKQQDSDKWLFVEKYDFIVFNHSRQLWKEIGDCECKGND